jgi:hypothetical protein
MNRSAFPLLALVATLSAATTQAQISTAARDSLRKSGELTGARPSAGGRGSVAKRPNATADPAMVRFIGEDSNPATATADEMPDLYDRFISTVRDERRQWAAKDWNDAGALLTRLNQRYEQVRKDLPIEERLRVRAIQGEFRTLRATR